MNRKQTIRQLLKASKVLTDEHGQWLKNKNYRGLPHACVISDPDAKDRDMIKDIAEATGIKFVIIEVATLRSMKKYWLDLQQQGAISEQEVEEKIIEYKQK